eukprot:Skav206925  [mRNA]  locus=scaffold6623:10254:15273:- [translate_table: standard]
MTRFTIAAGVATLAAFAAGAAFVVAPTRPPSAPTVPLASGVSGSATQSAGWGLAAAGLALGAHVGLAAAWRFRGATAARAEGGAKPYKETPADERLFEQGFAPDYPGRPIVKNGKYTSNVIGNLKAFSSNELAFLSMLFFGVGLYGNLQFNYYDTQWAKVDAGGYFNVSYIVEGATAARAEGGAAKPYKETPADERLFEQVYLQYTSEYMKGPMYWHPDKMQLSCKFGGKGSAAFSSNELAFLSMLFFGVGLYGNLQFNYYDTQWAKVDAGGYFNVSYIVESLLLPISFFMHIACYIQKQNGK